MSIEQRGPRRDGALGAAPRRFRAHLVGPQLAARDRQRLTLGAQAGEGAFVIADDALPPECQRRGRAGGARELAQAVGAEQQRQLAAPSALVEIDELRLQFGQAFQALRLERFQLAAVPRASSSRAALAASSDCRACSTRRSRSTSSLRISPMSVRDWLARLEASRSSARSRSDTR